MEKLQRLGAVEIEAEEQPPDGFDRLDMDAQAQGFGALRADRPAGAGLFKGKAP